MADYRLSALSAREFEHLVQALALKLISKGATPFGDGPDGGREATCRGRMNYRRATRDDWDGYLVIQAKFRQQPTGDTKKEGDWALSQLKGEIDKFSDPDRKLPKPNYYLYVTNVRLTAVQDTGSKDRAFALLEQAKAKLGWTDYDVWDYDKICRLLDDAREIRRRYNHFIAPGDVLSAMMYGLEGIRPDFDTAMATYLQGELLGDQYARLAQAGSLGKERTPLERVFVDLPVSDKQDADPPDEKPDGDGRLPAGCLAELIEAGNRELRSAAQMPLQEDDRADERAKPAPAPGRFVLVGGPGQGKSTVGQFLCQLYRTAVLSARDRHRLTLEAAKAIDHLEEQCDADRITLPAGRRFPVRVVLSQFADALARGEVNTLLDFIASRINKRTAEPVDTRGLRCWLGAYPWVIVLDGLDEVPAASNRAQVLDAVQQFWIECAERDADVVVVATTRPQGYSDEFSPQFYRHRYLSPLSTARAMRYAQRLADARFGQDVDESKRVIGLLRDAAKEDATARLMRSPLQVTIMHTLVEQGGEPPRERWKLFSDYYNVIFNREKQKGGDVARILAGFDGHIHFIHRQVGLRLQIDSEGAGTTQALLPIDLFQRMIETRLRDNEYDDDEVAEATERIRKAALDRLVFLVSPQADQIGFEIRSLQEFMAAEALVNDFGEEEELTARLEEIAPISHWRNVFLFAAGRCFAERDHLGQLIVGMCRTLNHRDDDPLWSAALAGSRLALDLLRDGAARQHPKYLKTLAEHALELLMLPPESAHETLAAVCQPRLEKLYRETLTRFLEKDPFQARLGAWKVLLNLVQADHDWVLGAAQTRWPEAPERAAELLDLVRRRLSCPWLVSKAVESAPRVRKVDHVGSLGRALVFQTSVPPWLAPAARLVNQSPFGSTTIEPEVNLPQVASPALQSRLLPIDNRYWTRDLMDLAEFPNPQGAWAPLVAAAKFARESTGLNLANLLRWLVGRWDPAAHGLVLNRAAWPLEACLASCRTADDVAAIADRAEAGQFGDRDDWLAAEKRWTEHGITTEDILSTTDERWPFDMGIEHVGFPYRYEIDTVNLDLPTAQAILDQLFELRSRLTPCKTRAMLADWVLDVLRECDSFLLPREVGETLPSLPDPGALRQIFEERFHGHRVYSAVLWAIPWPEEFDEGWIAFFDWLGQRQEGWLVTTSSAHPGRLAGALAAALATDPDRVGLLRLLALHAWTKAQFSVSADSISPSRYSEAWQRAAALAIRLTQPDFSVPEASELADVTAEIMSDYPDAGRGALMTLDRRSVEGPAAEQFVTRLLPKLPAEQREAPEAAHRLLRGWLSARTSRLGQASVQRKFGLNFLRALTDPA